MFDREVPCESFNSLSTIVDVGVAAEFRGARPHLPPYASTETLVEVVNMEGSVNPILARPTPLKRAFDLAVAAVILLVLAPVLGLVAVAVTLDSPGPILFRQRRTGLNGRTFTIYKFRSMTVEEDDHAVAHAIKNDPRVTRVGAFIRETSLDELPQLFNVLKGDMAIVGPRPHALAHDAYYGSLLPRYAERFAVRPGVTGLAQVRGHRGGINTLDCMVRRIEADVSYATTRSFFGDLAIILRTVPLVVKRINAY